VDRVVYSGQRAWPSSCKVAWCLGVGNREGELACTQPVRAWVLHMTLGVDVLPWAFTLKEGRRAKKGGGGRGGGVIIRSLAGVAPHLG
jgi:hypothetical protein